jgi:hypothetical protein
MRCYICNKDNAENLDKRDMKYFCDPCHEDIKQLIFDQEQEEEDVGYEPEVEKG